MPTLDVTFVIFSRVTEFNVEPSSVATIGVCFSFVTSDPINRSTSCCHCTDNISPLFSINYWHWLSPHQAILKLMPHVLVLSSIDMFHRYVKITFIKSNSILRTGNGSIRLCIMALTQSSINKVTYLFCSWSHTQLIAIKLVNWRKVLQYSNRAKLRSMLLVCHRPTNRLSGLQMTRLREVILSSQKMLDMRHKTT